MDITHYDTENRLTDKNLLYSTRNSAPLCNGLYGKESKQTKKRGTYKTDLLCIIPETNTTLYINYIPIIFFNYNKVFYEGNKGDKEEERSEFLPAQKK